MITKDRLKRPPYGLDPPAKFISKYDLDDIKEIIQ